MDEFKHRVDVLQTAIYALLGPNYPDGLGPRLRQSLGQFAIVTTFIDFGTSVSFDVREFDDLKEPRLVVPEVRRRLLNAYKDLQTLIESTITRLEVNS